MRATSRTGAGSGQPSSGSLPVQPSSSMVALFLMPPAAEATFARHWASSRHSSDLSFLRIHCLVAAGYMFKVPRLLSLQALLLLCGSALPAALYAALPKPAAHAWRTPIFAFLKICKTGALLADLTTDLWQPQAEPHPWVLLAFHLLFTARAVGFLAVGLGLPLPAKVDLPLHTTLTAAVMAYTVPWQCWGVAAAAAAASAPAAGPDDSGGLITLFQLNRDRFHDAAAVLDWPFAPVVGAQEALALSDQGMCTATFIWVQLVVGVLIPATMLVVSEAAERTKFLAAQNRSRPRANGSGSGGGQSRSPAFPWAYFLFGAQVCWCIIRTVVARLVR